MQDRYLSRGKREDSGEWAIGSLTQDNDGNYFIITRMLNEVTCCGECCMPYFEYHKVDPATIGQCAGLEDKNGKLIFEGDILRGGTEYRKTYGDPEVEYGCYTDVEIDALKYNSCPETNEDHDVIENLDSVNYGWYLDSKDYGESGIDPEYINIFEVIGNIHDKEQSN